MRLSAEFLVLAAAAALGVLLWQKRGTWFNPASDANLAYSGANALTQWWAGDDEQTFGGALYDAANPRAGLAANESSAARGVIVSVPASVEAGAYLGDYDLYGVAPMQYNPAGAVVGMVRKII